MKTKIRLCLLLLAAALMFCAAPKVAPVQAQSDFFFSASLGGCDDVYAAVFIKRTDVANVKFTYTNLFTGQVSVVDLGTGRSYRKSGVGCGAHFDVVATVTFSNGQTATTMLHDNHNRPCDQCSGAAQPVSAVNPAGGISSAPGSIISIYSQDFGVSEQSAPSLPLPTSLGGLFVLINGQNSPLFYVSPTQINSLIPTSVATGNASVEVHRPDGSVSGTAMPLFESQPVLFTKMVFGGSYAAATIERRADVTVFTLWGTGFNITLGGNQPNTGTVTLRLGGRTYPGVYVGPSYYRPDQPYPGLEQLNFIIPKAETPAAGSVVGANVTLMRNNGGLWVTPGVDVIF